MFNKENFISATFADQDKRYVEVLYAHNDEVHPFVVDTQDTDNPDTKRLFEFQDWESIELLTVQTKKEERKSFENTVLEIAKRDGLIPDTTLELSKDSDYISLDTLVFEWDEDNEKQKEALFQIKLKMFDMKHVKSSKKKAAKTNLRKAQTPLDVLVAYSKF